MTREASRRFTITDINFGTNGNLSPQGRSRSSSILQDQPLINKANPHGVP